MKKILIFVFSVLVAIVCVFFSLRFLTGEDNWICQNGDWVRHGVPSAPKPTKFCGRNDIKVKDLKPDSVIKSPFIITGKARGNWFFEANFSARILDNQGQELGTGIMQTTADWMTDKFVPFKGEIIFKPTASENGILVLEKANPAGFLHFEKLEIPIQFIPQETLKIKVYFNNDKMDPEFSCNKVFPVEREILKTQAVAKAALEELLKGPTDKEKTDGFVSNINRGVKVEKLIIKNGAAEVGFDEQLEFQVGGSCRVAAIRQQITQTLKQFPTVDDVIISINGRTEDILQP